jgi:hypothetical protein
VEDDDDEALRADDSHLVRLQFEVADVRVVKPADPADVRPYIVPSPQPSEAFAVHTQFADQLDQPRVVDVRADQRPQIRHPFLGRLLPVAAQFPLRGVEEKRIQQVFPGR